MEARDVNLKITNTQFENRHNNALYLIKSRLRREANKIVFVFVFLNENAGRNLHWIKERRVIESRFLPISTPCAPISCEQLRGKAEQGISFLIKHFTADKRVVRGYRRFLISDMTQSKCFTLKTTNIALLPKDDFPQFSNFLVLLPKLVFIENAKI